MMNNGVMGGTGPMGMNGMANSTGNMQMNPMGMGGMGGMGMNNQMGGMGMNNQMNPMGMGGMGMNNQMGGMGMNNQMNPMGMGGMGMNNQMNPMGMGMGMMPGMGMGMGMMPGMGMGMGMMPGMMGMQKAPLTEEQKKQIRMQGYLMGKQMAEQKKKNQPKKPAPAPVEEAPATGEIKVKFKKGGSVTEVKMDVGNMVAELINEYFEKTHTTAGTFKYKGNTLSPNDTSTLSEAGLRNNSEIIVS